MLPRIQTAMRLAARGLIARTGGARRTFAAKTPKPPACGPPPSSGSQCNMDLTDPCTPSCPVPEPPGPKCPPRPKCGAPPGPACGPPAAPPACPPKPPPCGPVVNPNCHPPPGPACGAADRDPCALNKPPCPPRPQAPARCEPCGPPPCPDADAENPICGHAPRSQVIKCNVPSAGSNKPQPYKR